MNPKRARDPFGGETLFSPSFVPLAHDSPVDLASFSYPFVATSTDFCSSYATDVQTNPFVTEPEPHIRKRIKTETMSSPTPANLGLTQGLVPLAEVEKSGTAHQHQSDGLCSLLTSIGCTGEAPGGLSFAQRVMNFGTSFLCPCCGFKFLALQDGKDLP